MACGGQPLYQPASWGEWSVDLGPIASLEFRKKAANTLHSTLVGVDPNQAEDLLRGRRCRAVSGLPQELAEAYAAHLDPQKTSAAAVFGKAPRMGLSGAFRYGLPVWCAAAGAAGALLLYPLSWVVGGAAAVAFGAIGASRRQASLGELRAAPVMPYKLLEFPSRLRHLWPRLDATGQAHVRDSLNACFAILAQLSNSDDLISVSLGGTEGGMGSNVVGLVVEAVRVAELLSAATDNEKKQVQLASLAQVSEAAVKTHSELIRAQNEMNDGNKNAVDQIQNELELMQRTVEQLKRVV